MLTLLPTPIGNLADITFRSLEALSLADVVMCEDIRVTKKLISLFKKNPIIVQHYSSMFEKKDFLSFHSHNQREFLESIDKDFFEKNVVFMSDAGMPCVSDPGMSLVAYAIKNNIAYDVLPGASAMVTAYSSCGFDLENFLFGGFLPHKQKDRRQRISNLLQCVSRLEKKACVVLYESPHRILEALKDIVSLVPDTRIFAIKEMTKIHQKFFLGYASEVFTQIEKVNTSGEWVLVLKANQKVEPTLSCTQVSQMDLPPKVKAKILSELGLGDVKSIYEKIIKRSDK